MRPTAEAPTTADAAVEDEPAGSPYVYEEIARAIADSGVGDVFGVLGDGNMLVGQGLAGHGVAFRQAWREDGAVAMATGCFLATGRPGVCTVTFGPGLTNTATALVEAVRARAGLLVLTGVPHFGETQYLHQREFVASLGAEYLEIERPADAYPAIRRILDRGDTYSRPVVVAIAPEILEVRLSSPSSWSPESHLTPSTPFRSEAVALAQLIQQAERPLILAGRGAVASGAREALLELAEASGALLGTSMDAKGLFTGHPRDVGLVGGFGSRRSQDLVDQADLVVAFGASMNVFTTAFGSLFGQAEVVMVDERLPGHRTVFEPRLLITADARETALRVTRELQRLGGTAGGGWEAVDTGAGALERRSIRGDGEPLETAEVLDLLDELLPQDRVVVTDTGHFMSEPARALSVREARGFLFAAHFCSVGLSLPTAIGAAVARRDRHVVTVLGDGGFLMGPQELDRAAAFGVDLTVVVIDDGGYGAEFHKLHLKGVTDPAGVTFDTSRIPEIARAYGAAAVSVRSEQDLRACFQESGASHGTRLLDVHVSPETHLQWHAGTNRRAHETSLQVRAWEA